MGGKEREPFILTILNARLTILSVQMHPRRESCTEQLPYPEPSWPARSHIPLWLTLTAYINAALEAYRQLNAHIGLSIHSRRFEI